MFMKPEADTDSKDTLGKLRTQYSLTAEPLIAAAFYFDIIMRTFTTYNKLVNLSKLGYPLVEKND